MIYYICSSKCLVELLLTVIGLQRAVRVVDLDNDIHTLFERHDFIAEHRDIC